MYSVTHWCITTTFGGAFEPIPSLLLIKTTEQILNYLLYGEEWVPRGKGLHLYLHVVCSKITILFGQDGTLPAKSAVPSVISTKKSSLSPNNSGNTK
ncbi:hypothetical protein [Desulfogranum marinum]|uniref:hypothetical protein n=1 Tax=Desulfogranum marinum TaxID=453220 RepID=UPI0029C6DBF1|nr:hypothetical protein [Desulfogranum marinum]